MAESSPTSVECPICGEAFDPTAAGGWCTNDECGEWKYEGEGAPEPAEGVGEASADADPLGEVTGSPPGDEDSGTDTAAPGDDEDEGGDDVADAAAAADEASVAADAAAAEADRARDDVADAAEAVEEELEEVAEDVEDAAEAVEDELEDVAEDVEDAAEAVEDELEEAAEEVDDVIEGEAADLEEHADEVDEVETGEGEADHDADDRTGVDVVCPECGASFEPGDNFCARCGAELPEPEPTGPLTACPSCGQAVDEDDSFCAGCGEDLDAHRPPATAAAGAEAGTEPEGLVLRARGREVPVEDGATVGREFRRIVTETGGGEDEAVRIHREHVRFLREDGRFYVVDLGDNPTLVNGERLGKGNRAPVAPGDSITLSNVLTAEVAAPAE